MSGVRPVRPADLPAIAALFDENAADGGTRPPSPVTGYLERTLLRPPSADPSTPSLVYEDPTGRVAGVLGVTGRPMRLDDDPVRVAVVASVLVHRTARGRGVGRLLFERVLDGPQDLTVCDTANAGCRAACHAAGGSDLVHACFEWRRVLRPVRSAASSPRLDRLPTSLRRVGVRMAPAMDTVVAAAPSVRRRLRPDAPDTIGEVLTAAELVRLVRADTSLRLRPTYEPDAVDAMFATLDSARAPGRSVRTRVRTPDGRVLGWYVLHHTPDGTAEVLGLRAVGPDPGPVLDHLLLGADREGATAVRGRLQPELVAALRTRRTTVVPGPWVLVHSRRPELLALLASRAAQFGRMDGEWWAGLQWRRGPSGEDHRVPFDRGPVPGGSHRAPDGSPVPPNRPHGGGTRA